MRSHLFRHWEFLFYFFFVRKCQVYKNRVNLLGKNMFILTEICTDRKREKGNNDNNIVCWWLSFLLLILHYFLIKKFKYLSENKWVLKEANLSFFLNLFALFLFTLFDMMCLIIVELKENRFNLEREKHNNNVIGIDRSTYFLRISFMFFKTRKQVCLGDEFLLRTQNLIIIIRWFSLSFCSKRQIGAFIVIVSRDSLSVCFSFLDCLFHR